MKTELKYGLLAGIGVSIYIFIEYLLGFHTTHPEIGQYSGYFSATIPVLAILFAIKEKRNRSFNGYISFGQGFITGTIVTIISAFIITGFFVLYNHSINPEGATYLSNWKSEQMRAENISEQEIAASIEEWNAMNNPLIIFTTSFLMGLIITVIFAFLLRRKKIAAAPGEV
ncbi:MAG: DUF4199 domain-containing protein [Bacteroidia bacterium]